MQPANSKQQKDKPNKVFILMFLIPSSLSFSSARMAVDGQRLTVDRLIIRAQDLQLIIVPKTVQEKIAGEGKDLFFFSAFFDDHRLIHFLEKRIIENIFHRLVFKIVAIEKIGVLEPSFFFIADQLGKNEVGSQLIKNFFVKCC